MVNIISSGIDAITGQKRQLTSSDTLTDVDGSAVSVGGLPTKYIQGMEVHVEGIVSEDVLVDPGSCRGRNDSADLVLSQKN